MNNKNITWLHTADLHLGQPVKGAFLSDPMLARQRMTDYLSTFERIIKMAQLHSPSFLFIAGDFLEHGYVNDTLLNFIKDLFQAIPFTQIFIAPGNHDPYRLDSCYRWESWPTNVHIFQDKWETHHFGDLTICGRGFSDFIEPKFIPPPDILNKYKFMVVHGTFIKNHETTDYFPLPAPLLTTLNYNYIAAGHIHKQDACRLKNSCRTLFNYPGSPEALNWKELGSRYITLGMLKNGLV
ncbi:MAG: hypothetical protein RLZ12_45, partial [Bacillota bacterium]